VARAGGAEKLGDVHPLCTHLGHDWYLLGGIEVPATHPKSFDYSLLSGLMYVF
jgi:hypothetical protein